MITQIGLTAGDIWNYLDTHNRTDKFEAIVKAIGKEREIVLMSMGWLAREGHIIVEREGADYTVRLTKKG